jgi:hypothetical protein
VNRLSGVRSGVANTPVRLHNDAEDPTSFGFETDALAVELRLGFIELLADQVRNCPTCDKGNRSIGRLRSYGRGGVPPLDRTAERLRTKPVVGG